MDGLLKVNLDRAMASIKKDWDYLFVIDGEVGAGKSVFTMAMAYYVSEGKLNLDNICFNPKQFKEAVLKANKYDAIVFDEAFRGLSARTSLSQTNTSIVSMLQEIRQKNLFVFIVLPSIWDLDKYVALHRCKGLFHVHTGDNKQRGFFKFYKREKLHMMFANPMKWRYKYPAAPQFKGRFTNYYALNEKDYRKKKLKSLGETVQPKELPNTQRIKKMQDKIYKFTKNLRDQGLTWSEIGNIIDIDGKTLAKSLEKWGFEGLWGRNDSPNLLNGGKNNESNNTTNNIFPAVPLDIRNNSVHDMVGMEEHPRV